jgi:hypothetical protein
VGVPEAMMMGFFRVTSLIFTLRSAIEPKNLSPFHIDRSFIFYSTDLRQKPEKQGPCRPPHFFGTVIPRPGSRRHSPRHPKALLSPWKKRENAPRLLRRTGRASSFLQNIPAEAAGANASNSRAPSKVGNMNQAGGGISGALNQGPIRLRRRDGFSCGRGWRGVWEFQWRRGKTGGVKEQRQTKAKVGRHFWN